MLSREGAWMDISATLKTGMVHWPGDPPVRIEKVQDMAKGDAANVSTMAMGSHTGTHMDAPLPLRVLNSDAPARAVLRKNRESDHGNGV